MRPRRGVEDVLRVKRPNDCVGYDLRDGGELRKIGVTMCADGRYRRASLFGRLHRPLKTQLYQGMLSFDPPESDTQVAGAC